MITLTYYNESYGKVDAKDSELLALWDAFSFYVPGYRFMPSFKNGTWDGTIHLINLSKKTFPVGLLPKIISFCKEQNYDFSLDEKYKETETGLTEQDIHDFIFSKKYYSKQKEITPREDQVLAITRALTEKRCINICPTSFGKSLCIFIEAMYHVQLNRKVLIIVPTVNLVTQFSNDIKDYCTGSDCTGTDNAWEMPNIQEIKAGKTKKIFPETEIVITTWQSAYKLGCDWFNQFSAIILDECHKAKAVCIKQIFDGATEVLYRTGWSGSLKDSSLTGLQAEALLGPIKVITDTAALMEQGVVADLTIQIVSLQYPPNTVKELNDYFKTKQETTGNNTYVDEIKFLENYRNRNNLLLKLAGCFDNTGLILYNHIAHGKELYRLARLMYPERNIYRIDGTIVERNDRKFKSYDLLKNDIEKEKDAILICSFGVFSTGISIKNLHYILFSVPIKSYIRTIQSIGRGLRVSNTKNKITLIDVVDDLRTRTKAGKIKKENYAYKHFLERFAIYEEQKFKYNIMPINIQ